MLNKGSSRPPQLKEAINRGCRKIIPLPAGVSVCILFPSDPHKPEETTVRQNAAATIHPSRPTDAKYPDCAQPPESQAAVF